MGFVNMVINKKSVLKPKGTLHVSNDLSRSERLLFNILLASCYDRLDKENVFYVHATDLLKFLGQDQRNYGFLKDILKKLNTTQIEWNVLNIDKQIEWGITTLLAFGEIKKGICRFEFSIGLREKILQSEIYARLWFHIQKKLTSKSATILYEFLLGFYNIKEKIGETPKLSLENFKKGIGKNKQYLDYRILNRDFIKPAITEINKHTDIYVKMKTYKIVRKIAFIKFFICRNKNYKHPFKKIETPILLDKPKLNKNRPSKPLKPLTGNAEPPSDCFKSQKNIKSLINIKSSIDTLKPPTDALKLSTDALKSPIDTSKSSDTLNFINNLLIKNFLISDLKQVQKWLIEFDQDNIVNTIKYTFQQNKNKKINSPLGYIHKVLVTGGASPDFKKLEREEQLQEEKIKAKQKKQEDEKKQLFEMHIKEIFKNKYQSLTGHKKKLLENRFSEHIKTKNKIINQRYKGNGFSDLFYEFYSFNKEKILSKKELNFKEWEKSLNKK